MGSPGPGTGDLRGTSQRGMGPTTRTKRRRLAAGTAALATAWIAVLVPAPPASACSCVTPTDQAAVDDADAVFTGTLVDRVPPPRAAVGSADPTRYVFAVDDVYEGDVTARQTVLTPSSGASCGFELSGTGPFLVFAFRDSQLTAGADDGELYSHLCSGTRPLDEGALAVDLASSPPAPTDEASGAPAPIDGEVSASDGGAGDGWATSTLALAGGGVLLVLVAGALVRARRAGAAEGTG